MLIGFEEAQFLIPEGNNLYRADISDCTAADIDKLRRLDKSYYAVYGHHIIVNYEELEANYESQSDQKV